MYYCKAISAVAIAATLLISSTQAAPMTKFDKRDLRFPYGSTKVRGVNLGGWFVLEPWITPSIFADQPATVVDEYTLTQTLGQSAALDILQPHWNTWITQTDFQSIAAAGFNYVRIPIGYWSVSPLEGDPYVQGAYEVLGQALDWASDAGLAVLIDLHGAPGSQNGFDNSGRKGPIDWTQGDTISQTETAIQQIYNDHGSHPAVAAIQPVNEPMGPDLDMADIDDYYTNTYNTINGNGQVATIFHDAFQGPAYWNSFLGGLPNILIDTHHYEVFDTGSLSLSQPSGHVSSACAFGASMATDTKWTISGEWTGAMTDCALWLNGRGVGARYDGSYSGTTAIGSCEGLSNSTVADMPAGYAQNERMFIEAQMDAYEEAAGWIWWTWKTESAPEWDAQALIAAGAFPNPVTDRQYPGQCS